MKNQVINADKNKNKLAALDVEKHILKIQKVISAGSKLLHRKFR